MKTRILAVAGLAFVLLGAGPDRPSTVYVPIFESQSFSRAERLQLTEQLIKAIEQRTPYKVVGSPDDADLVVEGTIIAGSNSGTMHVSYNEAKAVKVKACFREGLSEQTPQIQMFAKAVADLFKDFK
jgi:hypothetical protein